MDDAACKYEVNSLAVQSSYFMCLMLMTLVLMELEADMMATQLACKKRDGYILEW